jgi:hypothetical protein
MNTGNVKAIIIDESRNTPLAKRPFSAKVLAFDVRKSIGLPKSLSIWAIAVSVSAS